MTLEQRLAVSLEAVNLGFGSLCVCVCVHVWRLEADIKLLPYPAPPYVEQNLLLSLTLVND